MQKRGIVYHYPLMAVITALSTVCNDSGLPVVPYIPEATFTGYFNGVYDSLCGNRQWPNRCSLVGDTVRIYCYSEKFRETDYIRQGDLMRIDLFPDTCHCFTKKTVLFHLARYNELNESYTINRGDTVNTMIRFESEIASYSASGGAALELTDIFVATPPLSKGQYLEITEGRLFGSVH